MSNPPNSDNADLELRRQADVLLSKQDRLHHLQHHFWIKDKNGNVCLMKPLKKAQRMLHALLQACRTQWNIPARVLAYKSRQVGISTFVEADMFLEVMQHGYNGLVVAHDLSTAQRIHEILKRFYDYYDLAKPEAERSNKRETKFKDHEGYIEVITANKANAARGRTLHYSHISELAFYEQGTDATAAIFQAVPNTPNSTIIVETTPNGDDLLFKPMWEGAANHCKLEFDEAADGTFIPHYEVTNAEKWNRYLPFFIGALEDEDCYMPMEDNWERKRIMQTLDAYEESLMQRFSASAEFIKGRRHLYVHNCSSDIRILKREFPVTAAEGFVASGRPRFDHDKLDLMPLEDGHKGYLVRDDTWARNIRFVRDRQENLTLFRQPLRNHHYILAIDTAEGILPEGAKDPDASVGIVIDMDEGGVAAQVATFCGQLSEENIIDEIHMMADFYNQAFIVPELGGGHGTHLLEELLKRYPESRIYHRESGSIGWKSHVGNRKLLIDRLASAIADDQILIRDVRTNDECKEFKWNPHGKVEASPGHHDDHVIALALGVVGMREYPYPTDMTSPFKREVASPFVRDLYAATPAPKSDADPETGY